MKKIKWQKPVVSELDIADTKSGTVPFAYEGYIYNADTDTTTTLQGPS